MAPEEFPIALWDLPVHFGTAMRTGCHTVATATTTIVPGKIINTSSMHCLQITIQRKNDKTSQTNHMLFHSCDMGGVIVNM